MLENTTVQMGEMQSMLEKTEKKLSASKEMCNELTIQVNNLLDELKDRDIEIHTMAESVSIVITYCYQTVLNVRTQFNLNCFEHPMFATK